MNTISELTSRDIVPERWKRKKPHIHSASLGKKRTKKDLAYEDEVFAFLDERRVKLGIDRVERFKNLRVDDAIVLCNQRRLAIEIKLRMNMARACIAGWQFQKFLRISETKVDGGIVFFEEFSGDWAQRPTPPRLLEKGWSFWYATDPDCGHSIVDGLRLDLFRIRGERLSDFDVEMIERKAELKKQAEEVLKLLND